MRSPLGRRRSSDRGQHDETLSAAQICVRFEGVQALNRVDLALSKGEILGLVGPNGAGKTTMINVLTGFQVPASGRVTLNGVAEPSDITDWPPHRVAGTGVVRTFQNVRAFAGLSVEENVECGCLAAGLRRREARRRVPEILVRVGLEARPWARADSLSYGDQRRLGLARGLAMRPSFLLLDEPASGLNESESSGLAELLRRVRDEDAIGILIVEHDMRLIMGLCDRLHVLDHGQTLANGTPAQVHADPAVRKAYLGAGYA